MLSIARNKYFYFIAFSFCFSALFGQAWKSFNILSGNPNATGNEIRFLNGTTGCLGSTIATTNGIPAGNNNLPYGAAFDSNTGRLYYAKAGTTANTTVVNVYNNTGAVATNTNLATVTNAEYFRMGFGQDGYIYGTKTALVIQLSASAPRIDILTVKLTRYDPGTNTLTTLGNIQCPAAYASTMPAPYNTGDYWSSSDATTTPFYAAQLGNALYGDLVVSPDNTMYVTIGKKLIRIPNYSLLAGTGLIPSVEVGNILPTGVGFNFTTQGPGTYGISWDNANSNLMAISSRTSDGSDGSYNVNPATAALTGSFRVNCLATPTSANFADLTEIMSSIGAANRLVSVQWLGYDNRYRLTYQVRIENIGTSILKNVQSTFNISTAFPSLTISNVSTSFINNPASLVLNGSFTGTGVNTLLDGTKTLYASRYNGSNLNGGVGNVSAGSNFAILQVQFDVAGVATNGTTTYNMTATATGTGFDGTTVTDNSDNGTSVETGIANLKADDAGEGDPTPIKFGSTISGTVWNDVNNSANGTFFNIFTAGESGTNAGGLSAILVDPVTNLAINSVPVGSNGSYSFTNTPSFANLQVVMSTTAGTAGSTAPAQSLPSGWVFTSPGSTNTTGDINTGTYNSGDPVRFGAIDDFINDFGIRVANPPVILICPTNTTVAACQTQTAVNAAFTAWLATASASGGCSGVLTDNNAGAPSACGGSTIVTFTYTSTCAPLTTTCQATFTVSTAPTIILNCPTNTTVAACQTQSAVNAAFASWLATCTASGGCNGMLTNNNTGAPSACGGSTTVTFTYTSTCTPLTTTCQATFTVASAPPVLLTCPTNTTTPACQTQAAVNAAFTAWLASSSAFGGCNGVLTNNNVGAPSACGGSTTVTFTYTSTCSPLTTTCQATFTVAAAPPVIPTCPTNVNANGGQTQSAINMQFASWLATASATGGCNGVLTNNNTGAPPATGGSTIVTFTFTSSCAPITTTCQATFSVQQSNFYNTTTNTYFATLQDAINAANGMTPDTIELLDNMTESNITITHSVIIRANGFTLTIPSGTLSIPVGRSLTWLENNLIINPGAMIDNDGTLTNNGTINYQGGMGTFNNTGTYSGSGSFLGVLVNSGNVSPGN